MTEAMKRVSRSEKQEDQLNWAMSHLVSAQKRDWYGKLEIEFKNGMISIINCNQTFKPPEPE